MPFSSKSLIWERNRPGKSLQRILIVLAALLTIEQRLKHFNRPLTYFAMIDCVGSGFLVHPGYSHLFDLFSSK